MARTLAPMAERHAGTKPGAAADHQRAHAGLRVQRLQETSDNFRREHVLAGAQRDVGVGEREFRVALGHEKFARRATHGVEHAFVEHVPRAYLLRDHLARANSVCMTISVDWDATYSARNERSEGLRFVAEPVVTSLIFMVNVE